MTSLNHTEAKCGNRLAEDASSEVGYPQSLMLRMMMNASRRMARNHHPHLDPRTISENMRRDLGFTDWRLCDAER
ncbi:hypothetical protein A6U87_26545 [Rhizobium sp. AC44/96]|uniref:hypothetical protein n=1 Tax=Rhizobium sp. AC44/96 TaxID=1841654 RepID=UPI0008100271|nr:hypothetical protein [Rhizobium sp. AC44/96]OCJ14055.1 hypothetical protein A6U87_26545 [Rhizobium sp. AC44/96]